MSEQIVRSRLKEEVFRKYKAYCGINNISMTDQTSKLIREFVEKMEKEIKIVKVSRN